MPAYQLTFRTNDPSAWGTGFGAPITWVLQDQTIWNLNSRLLTVESEVGSSGKKIDYIAESGGALYVHYTDHSVDGPFPIPVTAFNWRGPWLPTQNYAVNDVTTYLNGIYLCITAFTSGSTFQTIVGGNTVLQLMLMVPAIATRTVSTATFSPDTTYANTYIRCTNTSGCAVTILNDTSEPWQPDVEMQFRDSSLDSPAGGLSFIAGSGVTLNPIHGRALSTAVAGAVVGMKHVAANTWDVWGLLAFAP